MLETDTMNVTGAWTFIVLLISVASNPVMKYSFCPFSNAQCEATNFASSSPFQFGNITSGVYFREEGEEKLLSVSCSFHEPLHWILTAPAGDRVNSISSNVSTNGSHLLYYYHIHFSEPSYGLIRCESYDNPDLAAEIFIALRNKEYDYRHRESLLIKVFPTILKRGGQMIVPCSMKDFDPNFDPSIISLKKMRRTKVLKPKLTPECFSCFPRNEGNAENCTTACPYGISPTLWNDAGQPLALGDNNNTGNGWLDCVGDRKCAFKALTKAVPEGRDCNGDGETSCSDHFSGISSYPNTCKKGSASLANFIKIEDCALKNISQSLDFNQADYDPRIGFRLKIEQTVDTVYICPSKTTGGVYYMPYNPNEKIGARLQASYNNKIGPLKGLVCFVPIKRMESVDVEAISCSTLFDCELQLETFEGKVNFREINEITNSESISEISPQFYGRIMKNPPRSGVVMCNARFLVHYGYIWDLQYFFTGLDSKTYFVSTSMPGEAVISLRTVQTNTTTLSGFEVECTTVNFIIFPNFEFLIKYSNGTIMRRTKQTSRHQPHSIDRSLQDFNRASQRVEESGKNGGASVVSITCRAPFRNSQSHAEALLMIESHKELGDEGTDGSLPVNVLVIVILVSAVLVLGSATCAIYNVRKRNTSKELKQLTLEEINDFLNGNAALATGCSSEVNVDGIGFPESFQIPPTDLQMHMQEVLGEGEFGRCVSGDFHNQKVAVKTTKTSLDVEAFKEFLREVKIMAYLGKHENIVEFLGAVVNQLRDRICIAVVELSPYGNLLNYLRQNNAENPSNVNLYANLTHGEQLEASQGAKLEVNHLSYFCEQIASAMEFVVEKRVIHGDLAARNVLVFPDYVVKITDFGLSRKLYTASNYKKKSTTPLPWRWMAIESLKYMEFSPMTDMWAYGVTVWEIFTLGEVPYAGLVYSHEFVDEVEQGRRLQRPKNASEEVYQFMSLTWNRIPSARPCFKDAKNLFRRLSPRNQ